MTPLLKKILGMNWLLTLVMYALLVFGLFAIESAARHLRIPGVEDPGVFLAGKQKTWVVLGSLVYFATALVDYRWVKWLAVPAYLCGLELLFVLLTKEEGVHQLEFAGQKFQPTQFMIAGGIIMLGVAIQHMPKTPRWLHWGVRILTVGLLTGIPFFLVVKSGDMGSALVWVPVSIVALLVMGTPWRYLIFIGQVALGALAILYYVILPAASPRGAERVDSYLTILRGGEMDKVNRDYAAYWVSTAVGIAGWKGVGWKAGPEKGGIHGNGWVPKDTAHNDYIFAVVAEEFGFRGSSILIMAFCLLIILCLVVAFCSRDFCGQMIAAGVVALLFAHLFENVGMCLLIMPITGIPLPLVSYSGTFVLICMFLLGLVQSIWVHRGEAPGAKKEEPAEE